MHLSKEQIKVGCAYMFKHIGGEHVEPNHIVFVTKISERPNDSTWPVSVVNNTTSGYEGIVGYDELFYIEYPSQAFTLWQ